MRFGRIFYEDVVIRADSVRYQSDFEGKAYTMKIILAKPGRINTANKDE